MKNLQLLFLLICLFGFSCDESEEPTDSNSSGTTVTCPTYNRTGALCKDGSSTSATGSGACSGHGGVEKWLCK